MNRTYAFLLVAVITLVMGCELVGSSTHQRQEARIVFGEHIDGVSIGDDTTAVLAKTGYPDQVGIGDFPGISYGYTSGRHAGLSIVTWTEEPRGVMSISMTEPYEGQSEDQVGIRSLRAQVLVSLGEPDTSLNGADSTETVDHYVYEDTHVGIIYTDGRISQITMSRR